MLRTYDTTAVSSSSGIQFTSVEGMNWAERPSFLMPKRMTRASSPSV
jgi:hypothetical protein